MKVNRRVERDVPARTDFGAWFGLLFAAVFVATLAAGVREVLDPATLPIRQVRIDGDLRHVAPVELQRMVAAEVNAGFFRVDVQAIRGALLAQPWIDSVTVQRVWPDQLRILVSEQTPIATWGQDALLNERAVAFRAPRASFPAGLPHLTGPPGTESAVLEGYRLASRILATRNLAVGEITLTDRRAWRLRLVDGPEIIVGRADLRERLERLMAFYQNVFSAGTGPVAVIDLRYMNGFAVRPVGTAPNKT